MNRQTPYWVAFSLVRGIGAVRFRTLLDFFGSPEIAWQAPAEGLRAAGLSEKLVENVLKVRSSSALEATLARIEGQGISVLTWEDETYPRRLREIAQPPPVLYLRGSLTAEDDWCVALVGTRRASAYGRQVTEEIASALARSGVTVVSGLARGVDACAHQAALDAGGRSLGVLGCGVDIVYPPENRRLFERMLAQGGLISDYPPGTPPDAANFPPRNRIISGLGMAVVIIEAGESSGALITASFAAEQGREVFAVPGNITSPLSRGTNRLISDGAHPLLSPQNILETLELTLVTEQRAARSILPADALEAQLYAAVGQEPLHVDEIRARTELPIEKVTATLALMELKGMVRQVGGMNYVAVREIAGEYRLDGDQGG
jgi:DNA processing protein